MKAAEVAPTTVEIIKGIATVKNLKLGKELSETITDKKEWISKVQKEVPINDLVSYIKEQI